MQLYVFWLFKFLNFLYALVLVIVIKTWKTHIGFSFMPTKDNINYNMTF